MSQLEPSLSPADAARQQLQQLQGQSSQLLAELMHAQQHKLSQMVRQLQNPPEPATAAADVIPAATPGSAENAAEDHATLAGVLQLQRDNMGNLDLLLQRIHATMQRALATAGSEQGGIHENKTGAAV